MYQTKYANAYTEVYEILSCLNIEEYNKIPQELIDVIEENRNLDYEYELNEEQDLMNQPMLKETKAILLNIFRDYLATSEQSNKIKIWLQKDREYLQKQKVQKYSSNIFENKDIYQTVINKQLPIKAKHQSFFTKILSKMKNFFKK